MRHLVLIILCLMSLAVAGTASAACATDFGACGDTAMAVQKGSAATSDCNGSQKKAHSCAHDACCGYQLFATAEVRDISMPSPPREAIMASAAKHLTGFRSETLLDPPRA